ncbi:hypothetical protein Y1Q_0003322 [Alligator mississippiensis]|uniref:Uncharacterized protein n=1 Tax=Alligator mississippiensis TaxID=8496 RepID=A0A151ME99_ALLMI|nr:hypothetical protein Y1Q_0003322 [Alligator mississippiensis]
MELGKGTQPSWAVLNPSWGQEVSPAGLTSQIVPGDGYESIRVHCRNVRFCLLPGDVVLGDLGWLISFSNPLPTVTRNGEKYGTHFWNNKKRLLDKNGEKIRREQSSLAILEGSGHGHLSNEWRNQVWLSRYPECLFSL